MTLNATLTPKEQLGKYVGEEKNLLKDTNARDWTRSPICHLFLGFLGSVNKMMASLPGSNESCFFLFLFPHRAPTLSYFFLHLAFKRVLQEASSLFVLLLERSSRYPRYEQKWMAGLGVTASTISLGEPLACLFFPPCLHDLLSVREYKHQLICVISFPRWPSGTSKESLHRTYFK